jgi:hypothetical protein
LQDVVDARARLGLDLLQAVDVPGIQHQRLFADGVGAIAQGEPDVGIVQVVRRADADIVDGRTFAAQFVDVAVEALELGEEIGCGKVAVDDADAVVGVERGDQPVAGVLDGAHVARGDEAGGADEGEGLAVHRGGVGLLGRACCGRKSVALGTSCRRAGNAHARCASMR